VAGGNKRLTFSPDGRSLVVYDVGKHGDVYLLEADTGVISWRFRLEGRSNSAESGGSALSFDKLQFTPSGQTMVADVVESTVAQDAYLYYHYLVLLTPDGKHRLDRR